VLVAKLPPVVWMEVAVAVTVLVLLLGLLAGVIVLLVNPKTRLIAALTLSGIVVVGMLGALFLTAARFEQRPASVRVVSSVGDTRHVMVLPETTRIVAEVTRIDGEPAPRAAASTTAISAEAPPAERVVASPAAGGRPADKKETTRTAEASVDRPKWVNQPARRVGDAYQMSITVGPYTTRMECDHKLPQALSDAASQYVELAEGPEAARRVRLPLELVQGKILKEQWEETIHASVGPMIQLHVLLEFDHKVQDYVKEQLRRAVVTQRLWYAGAGVLMVMVLLAETFAYLKLGRLSNPAQRRGLRIAAVLAILVVVAAALAVAA